MRDEGKKLAVFGKLREKMRDEGEKLGRFGKCWWKNAGWGQKSLKRVELIEQKAKIGHHQRCVRVCLFESSWTTESYFPVKVHAVFSSQTVSFCARLLWALTKTWPDVFWTDGFSSVKIVLEVGTSLNETYSTKNKSNPKSGLGMESWNTCANFRVYVLETACASGPWCEKHVKFASLPLIT